MWNNINFRNINFQKNLRMDLHKVLSTREHCIPIPTDILYHIRMVVYDFGLSIYFFGILGFIGAITYLNYQETLIVTTMNSENYSKVLFKLVIINFICKMLLGIMKETFQNKLFLPKFKNSCVVYLSKMFMEHVDASYLESQEKIHDIIPDGANAISNLGVNIINVIEPFFTIFSSILALCRKVVLIAIIPVVVTLIVFFIIGLSILKIDYVRRKNLQKEINKNSDIVRNLWETYMVYYLNGLGSSTIREISDISLKNETIYWGHKSVMGSLYCSLNWIMYMLSAITTYLIMRFNKSKDNSDYTNKSQSENDNIEVFAMFFVIIGVFNTVWWLFCTVRDALTSTASWGTIELYIQNYVSRKTSELEQLTDPVLIFPQFSVDGCNELRLDAQSGGGKTTWMKRKVVSLMKKYKGGWLYLDQKMKLPNDNRTIRQVMHDYIHVEVNCMLYEKILCDYSKMLGINNIINKDTLDCNFTKPSGGEEKRILTLRALLPIILGFSNVLIIFNDEITAGLDYDNWKKVRTLIEEIKLERGVKFVTIDHHDFDAPKLSIKKKLCERKTKASISHKQHFVSYLSSLFTSGIIKEDKEPPKNILVWIDGFEDEPNEPIEEPDETGLTDNISESSDTTNLLSSGIELV